VHLHSPWFYVVGICSEGRCGKAADSCMGLGIDKAPVDVTDARNTSGPRVSQQAHDTNCRTQGGPFRNLAPIARIMHTLGQGKYENENKAIGQQDFRPSITAELPKQTALQRTAPTLMR